MDEERLAEIERLLRLAAPREGEWASLGEHLTRDGLALVAEVRRLQALVTADADLIAAWRAIGTTSLRYFERHCADGIPTTPEAREFALAMAAARAGLDEATPVR